MGWNASWETEEPCLGGGVGGCLGSLLQAWGEDFPSARAARTHCQPSEAASSLSVNHRLRGWNLGGGAGQGAVGEIYSGDFLLHVGS